MNKKMLVIILGILVIGLSGSIFYYTQVNTEEAALYNMNPDNSKKIQPPDKMLMSNGNTPVSVMANDADLIAKVKVINREEMVIDSGIEIKNMPKKDLPKIGLSDKALVTKVTFQVLKEYKGKAPTPEIVTYQLGKKDADDVSIRLMDEKIYIAFLSKIEEGNEINDYRSYGEKSYFVVDKNNKLTSLETKIEYAKYDTLDETVLIKDIKGFN